MSQPERRPALVKPQRVHPATTEPKPPAASGGGGTGKLVTLSVRVPEDHLRRLKVAAAASGETMQELVDRAVVQLLDERGL